MTNSNKIELTFTQCKQIIENGYELREVVEQLNEVPEWAYLTSISDIQSVIQCGAASNAHISCFYADAKRIFMENTQEIEEELEALVCEPLKWDVSEESFDQFISNCLQMTVESIANKFADQLDGVNWD